MPSCRCRRLGLVLNHPGRQLVTDQQKQLHMKLPAILVAFVSVVMLLLAPFSTCASQCPNIVLILADDMGWTDAGCYGADLYETPHIDGLAAAGVRFTDAYAMPVCSPTRAALMTGRHAARVHMTIWSEGSLKGPQNRKLLQADSLHSLPHTETTLAKNLQDAGYLTALVGKWHLGDGNHYPETHGFDVNIGGTHWGAPQTFLVAVSRYGKVWSRVSVRSAFGVWQAGRVPDRSIDRRSSRCDRPCG